MKLSFRRNLGKRDRAVRGLIGLTVFFLAAFRVGVIAGPVSIILMVIGIPLIFQASAGY